MATASAFSIGCPIYGITGIPCPTCGMTRAIISLLHGDMKSYIAYNAFTVPVAIVFILELFIKAFIRHKTIIHSIAIIVLVLNLVYYICRL